ncbi:MAG: DUF4440 domain-containing protein [Solirubrobacterales bacterium]|nr:DUF4440 domain-containing protein [Solirubrobacterales bacterium]
MNDQHTEIHAIEELETAWSQAEMRADTGTLEAISTSDFTLVGPLGFVLDKEQWLERYRSGDLVTDSLSLEDPAIRVYRDAAVTLARTSSALHTRAGRPMASSAPPTSPCATTAAGCSPASISARSAGLRRSRGRPSREPARAHRRPEQTDDERSDRPPQPRSGSLP